MTARMAQLQSQFASEKDVRLVSITMDPAQDTRGVLVRYAERFGADRERWLFLTGKKEATYRLVQEGFHLETPDPRRGPPAGRRPAEGPSTSALRFLGRGLLTLVAPAPARAHEARGGDPIHASRFVLVDRRGRIRGYYASEEPEALQRLRRDVRILLEEA